MTKGLKSFVVKLAAFLAGALLLTLCLEVSLRLFGSRYAARLSARGQDGAYTVLCVGDSFTYGAGAPAESSYPRQLENVLKERFPGQAFSVVNFGESGQNTAQLLDRLPQALDKVRPDAVILLSGLNNFWNYWGYRDDKGPRRPEALDRVRVARLAKLLWREVSRRAADRAARRKEERRLRCRGVPEHGLCIEKMKEFKDIDGILEVCKTAVRKCPQDMDALKSVGFTYLNTFRPVEALEWLKKAADEDPGDPLVYIGISNALGKDRAEAERWMRLGALRTGGGTAALLSGNYDVPAWIKLDLDEISGLASAHGTALIFQNYPSAELKEAVTASDLLRRAAAARSLPFADQAFVFSKFVAAGRRDDYFAYKDPHCSARGYRIMAEQVADVLAKKGLVRRGAAK
ncbi:MAG TPA: hypothetical protein DCZ92_14345 [Elusimicrobia bacterium]|nr:MAG: hypothetical protein A2016_08935 [Elusimicrobia bacterium GWF2_62_30]HBA61963.1 hypothetical protein [Elusimicrobiota bacterium]